MNEMARKLRDASVLMKGALVTSTYAISLVRKALDAESTPTSAGDLGAVLDVIADELDELQARASEANELRQKLESAEKKAERRKQHIEYLNTAIRDKNALLEQRGGTIARLTAEHSELCKQVPSDKERQILAMWPRFEDTGEPVMVGDAYVDTDGDDNIVAAVRFDRGCADLVGAEGFYTGFDPGERVKRPVQRVLDADGVEIKVGDTVYELETGEEYKVERVFSGATDPDFPDHTIRCNKVSDCITHVFKADQLTHTRPDSWERLEEDAESIRQTIACNFGDFSPSDFKQSGDSLQDRVIDLIRRAKALADVEVAE